MHNAFVIADPQDITCWAMCRLLTHNGLAAASSVRMCDSAHGLKQLLQQLSQDDRLPVVVLDYTLLDLSEEELLILSQRFARARFILFSDQLSTDFLRRMLYGSTSFSVVLKDDSLDEIVDCMRRNVSGFQYICPRIHSLMESGESTHEDKYPLTATEREILRSLALGRTTKEIAAERFLSVYTVMTHRKNIFRKLHVNNVQEAVRMAYRLGIANPMEYYI